MCRKAESLKPAQSEKIFAIQRRTSTCQNKFVRARFRFVALIGTTGRSLMCRQQSPWPALPETNL
jgi:hypothetical protein